MKKRGLLLVLLCALILCPGIVKARELNTVTAVIDGKTADRVHLRESPSTGSKSLGLYFTGTEVLCDPDATGEWVWVNVGDEAGYIKADYLYLGPDPGSVAPKQPTGTVNNQKAGNWVNLRHAPSYTATVTSKLNHGDTVTVLGQTATQWYYVQAGGLYGYIQAAYLLAGDSSSNTGNAPGDGGSSKVTTTKADPKDSVEAYATIKNCTLYIVPTDESMAACKYDSSVLRFEQSIARGVHMLTVESISGKRMDHRAAATLYLPREVYHAVFVNVQNGEASIASGIDCLFDISGADARLSIHYPAGNEHNYLMRFTNTTCVFGISENATDYTIDVQRIQGSNIRVPVSGMPAYKADASTYGFTSGNGNAKISVDALKNSTLEFAFVR